MRASLCKWWEFLRPCLVFNEASRKRGTQWGWVLGQPSFGLLPRWVAFASLLVTVTAVNLASLFGGEPLHCPTAAKAAFVESLQPLWC